MLRKSASRRAGSIPATLALAFLASCGGSNGGTLFDGATAGASSTAGRSNAQSGGAGTGGSATASTGGSGMSGAMSAGASSPPASNGGAAIAGRSNASGGSTIATGGNQTAAGAGPSAGGSVSANAGGGGSNPGGRGGNLGAGGGNPGGGGGLGGPAVQVAGGVGGGVTSGGIGGAVSCAPVAERCDGLDNNCNGVADEGKACPAACQGFAIEGHGYMFCSTETGLGKGQLACEGQGLRLAWIETGEENQALVTTLMSLTKSGGQAPTLAAVAQARIGATDSEAEGEWHWIAGAAFWSGPYRGKAVGGAYENWSTLQPDDYASTGQDCATLLIGKSGVSAAGEWDDVPCTQAFPVLCEVP